MRNIALEDVDHVDRAVLPIGTDYPPGHLLDWHEHRRAQFLYGATGVMVVDTADGTWTVPPERAVLIPAATRHRVRMLGVSTRSLYVEPDAVPWWPTTCMVVDVPPLLRELLLAAVEFEADYDLSGRGGAIAALLLHEIAARTPLPFHVRMPASAELVALCREYLAAPDAGVTNAVWAARVAMSERAFTRRFRTETGESPAVWRARARTLAAVPLLRTASVSEVAGRLGYASPAAFTAAFSRALGVPPSRFTTSRDRGDRGGRVRPAQPATR
ncbi:helix-turn-helix transcriptional regulator [Streptomyces sp. TRM S81-3]|uniref:Helix-turn-helix transcriptional regulator n=1 Tax=Streptomyces griseicoloratus TaxID=2752516 RepID=A0A926QUT7_9ACTN|nr:helix-turn-helix transcriptional regulator [Streptomyces griseicoloratus]MBD0424511.1 helix-turn-helix transcriptional regulator [Streptomyces griseicoloratus]